MVRIALDGMGGDFAPKIACEGAMLALETYQDIEITIFGDQEKMSAYLKPHERLKIVHTSKYLDMGVKDPIKEIRKNKDNSLFLAMQAVKEGQCDALVTAGPTQGVVVGAHFIIKKLKSIHKIALAPIMPSVDGIGRILLDAGANKELKPENVVEFAICGQIIARDFFGVQNPSVGLLNIGSEPGKGREFDIEAFNLLEESENVNFFGNIEAKEILYGEPIVVVNDGFTCNIAMKAIEGAGAAINMMLKKEISRYKLSKLGYLFMKRSFKNFKKKMDASEVGGAMIIGLQRITIKAHGSSDAKAICSSLNQAKRMVESNIIEKLDQQLSLINKLENQDEA